MTAAQVRDFLQRAGMKNFFVGKPKARRHVFSHLEWEMTAYTVDSEEDARALHAVAGKEHSPFAELAYFPVAAIEREISLPSAFRWCLPLLCR